MKNLTSSKPPEEEDVNYVLEMFRSRGNLWGLCAALIGGSVAAVATGIAPAILIPVVLQAGINGILSMFLPDSPVFREAVDRRRRKDRREAARQHIVQEIDKRVGGAHANWETYHRMQEQLASLRAAAKDSATELSLWDVERLDETAVNFLRLWLARLTIVERQEAIDIRGVQAQARDLQRKLKEDGLSPLDRNRLQRALADLDKVLERRGSFDVQDSAMAAQMLSMADGFSEVYHRIMANPAGEDLSAFLEGAVERMNVSEELDFAADMEIDALLGASRTAREAAQRSLAGREAESEASAGEAAGRSAQRTEEPQEEGGKATRSREAMREAAPREPASARAAKARHRK